MFDFLDGGKYLARDIDGLHSDFMRHGSSKYGHPYFLKTRELIVLIIDLVVYFSVYLTRRGMCKVK